MCLTTVLYGKRKREELTRLPDMVRCWKIARRKGKKYWPEVWNSNPFKAGWNEVKPMSMYFGYWVAFHAYRNKKDAERCKSEGGIIVQCRTKKEDITAIGKQYGALCIVTKRIWIPKPKTKRR